MGNNDHLDLRVSCRAVRNKILSLPQYLLWHFLLTPFFRVALYLRSSVSEKRQFEFPGAGSRLRQMSCERVDRVSESVSQLTEGPGSSLGQDSSCQRLNSGVLVPGTQSHTPPLMPPDPCIHLPRALLSPWVSRSVAPALTEKERGDGGREGGGR